MTILSTHDPVGQAGGDPFGTASEVKPASPLISGGRYRLPDLTIKAEGHAPGKRVLVTGDEPRKGGWQRVTTLVKAIGDARALDLWHQREILKGLAARPDLYDLVCAEIANADPENPRALRAALESLAGRILVAAGADAGANIGTAFHGFVDAEDQGLRTFARPKWHAKIRNYRSSLAAHRLEVVPEYIERRVVLLRYGAAGTLDRLLRDLVAQCLIVGDLKSQKAFWGWLEISAQLAAYSLADAMWDPKTLRYVDMPPVSQESAVVAWMPVRHSSADTGGDPDAVEVYEVDLAEGRAHLDMCYKVDRMRSAAKSARQRIAWLRPLPDLGQVESYAARLRDVASAREGSALWAEITTRGLDIVPELQEVAREIARNFLPQRS